MAKKKPAEKPSTSKGTSSADKARVLKSRIKASGKTSRGKGHLSASTRRSQAKRDGKAS
jgi:hypothetical protein